jgi:hypothetical protein
MKKHVVLARSSVTILTTTEERNSSSTRRSFSNRGKMGLHPAAEQPLLDALTELGRLAGLYEHTDAARAALARGINVGAGERYRAGPQMSNANAAAYHGGEGDPD